MLLPDPRRYMTAKQRADLDAFHDAINVALQDKPDMIAAIESAETDKQLVDTFNSILRLLPRNVRRLAKLADRAELAAELRQTRGEKSA